YGLLRHSGGCNELIQNSDELPRRRSVPVTPTPTTTRCRLCGAGNLHSVVDLGASPPCERFLTAAQLDEPEPTYPLHLRVCPECWLAQLPPLITPEDTF